MLAECSYRPGEAVHSFFVQIENVFLLLDTPGPSPAGGAPLCGSFVTAKVAP